MESENKLLKASVLVVLFCSFVSIIILLSMENSYVGEDLEAIMTDLNEIRSDIDILNASLSELQDDLASCKNSVKELEMAVETHSHEIEAYANELALLEVKQEYVVVPGILTKTIGVAWFEGHKETYYNLPMDAVINRAKAEIDGYSDAEYTIRADGAKMLGDYIMVAADYNVHPYGSIVMTSLGEGIVVDTGSFIFSNSKQIDIATNW